MLSSLGAQMVLVTYILRSDHQSSVSKSSQGKIGTSIDPASGIAVSSGYKGKL
jgi:hypothetical protein